MMKLLMAALHEYQIPFFSPLNEYFLICIGVTKISDRSVVDRCCCDSMQDVRDR